MPHGDLELNDILFDESMESHLGEFGFKFLAELNEVSLPSRIPRTETGGGIQSKPRMGSSLSHSGVHMQLLLGPLSNVLKQCLF